MYMLELHGDGNVLLYGTNIGNVNDESVRKLLMNAGESEWSRELKSYIEDWRVEYDRCPVCGRKNFYYHRAVNEDVQVGFCLHCKEDIVDNQGKIETLRKGLSGVLVEHNKLYPTPEKPAIILSYKGGQE